MKAHKRWLFARLFVMGLIFVGLMVAVAPQSARAASCSGSGCNGQDPGTTGCSDSSTYTVYSRDVSYSSSGVQVTVRVYLRYSPTCGTNWAKASIISSNPSNYSTQIAVTLKDTNDNSISGTQWGVVGRSVYGNMYYAPSQPVKACESLDYWGGGWYCTSAG